MDEQTTTDAPVQDQATLESQPEEQHAEAVTTTDSEPTTTNDEQQTQEEPEAQTSDNSDDDLAEWAAKKGYDFSTPEGQAKALKSMREAEKTMHQATQRSSELEKQLQGVGYDQVSEDPVAQKALETAASVQLELQVERWKQSNGITPEQDAAIASYLETHQDKTYLLKNGYLSLDDVAAMSGALKQDTQAIKTQGSRETLEKLANKQIASAVPASASTNTAPAALTKANAEAWWDGLGPAGRSDPENRAKLDAVLSA